MVRDSSDQIVRSPARRAASSVVCPELSALILRGSSVEVVSAELGCRLVVVGDDIANVNVEGSTPFTRF